MERGQRAPQCGARGSWCYSVRSRDVGRPWSRNGLSEARPADVIPPRPALVGPTAVATVGCTRGPRSPGGGSCGPERGSTGVFECLQEPASMTSDASKQSKLRAIRDAPQGPRRQELSRRSDVRSGVRRTLTPVERRVALVLLGQRMMLARVQGGLQQVGTYPDNITTDMIDRLPKKPIPCVLLRGPVLDACSGSAA